MRATTPLHFCRGHTHTHTHAHTYTHTHTHTHTLNVHACIPTLLLLHRLARAIYIQYTGIYGVPVCSVIMAGKLPNIRLYTVYTYGSGQPYSCTCHAKPTWGPRRRAASEWPVAAGICTPHASPVCEQTRVRTRTVCLCVCVCVCARVRLCCVSLYVRVCTCDCVLCVCVGGECECLCECTYVYVRVCTVCVFVRKQPFYWHRGGPKKDTVVGTKVSRSI